ncbi:MAG: hypothetical protein F6J97_13255 [Leptolyngbya sp. SIO4C1]|nr:hypothetical protein [Leptolyngbya sp. SIO4C1]
MAHVKTQITPVIATLRLGRLLAFFLLVGLLADFAPHPSLGPSLLQQALSSITQPASASQPD